MHSRKTVPIPDLMSAANMELIRLDFKSSTLSRHSKEFRSFSNYCRENEIISMKMGYWTMTYLQVFQGQRSTLKKISPKRGPQRKYDNYCPLLTAAMRLEKEITRCFCLLFCWA